MPERTTRSTEPVPWERKAAEGDGPRRPNVQAPDTQELLKKMRRVDPNQARRYRQRTGQ